MYLFYLSSLKNFILLLLKLSGLGEGFQGRQNMVSPKALILLAPALRYLLLKMFQMLRNRKRLKKAK
jgi:hypothetical protein